MKDILASWTSITQLHLCILFIVSLMPLAICPGYQFLSFITGKENLTRIFMNNINSATPLFCSRAQLRPSLKRCLERFLVCITLYSTVLTFTNIHFYVGYLPAGWERSETVNGIPYYLKWVSICVQPLFQIPFF